MDLSPNDIRNCEFSSQMRGYSKDEVDSLLEQVATALETVKQENLKLSMEVDSLKTQLAGLRQFEDTIKNAAIDARRNADMTVNNAKQEAELILSKAKAESDKIMGSHAQQLADIEANIRTAEMTKRSYLNKVRSMITSHLELIDQLIDPEASSEEAEEIQVTQSSEVDRKTLETVGTPSKPEESIKTEEVNAAEQIVEAPTDSQPKPAEDAHEEPESADDESKPIDPELAFALEKYQSKEAEAKEEQHKPPAEEPVPPAGQMIETTALAEDIPHGFIAGPSGNSDPEKIATDKLTVENKPKVNPIEEMDHTGAVPMPTAGTSSPQDLAEELDKVVAKFEEEMDKAAKL